MREITSNPPPIRHNFDLRPLKSLDDDEMEKKKQEEKLKTKTIPSAKKFFKKL